jgi:hypothetical protein
VKPTGGIPAVKWIVGIPESGFDLADDRDPPPAAYLDCWAEIKAEYEPYIAQ